MSILKYKGNKLTPDLIANMDSAELRSFSKGLRESHPIMSEHFVEVTEMAKLAEEEWQKRADRLKHKIEEYREYRRPIDYETYSVSYESTEVPVPTMHSRYTVTGRLKPAEQSRHYGVITRIVSDLRSHQIRYVWKKVFGRAISPSEPHMTVTRLVRSLTLDEQELLFDYFMEMDAQERHRLDWLKSEPVDKNSGSPTEEEGKCQEIWREI